MTHGELKKKRKHERHRCTEKSQGATTNKRKRQKRGTERARERERGARDKRGSENEGRNERQVQSRFPLTKSTPGVDLVARFGNLNLHQ
jgi:hypothetical protein